MAAFLRAWFSLLPPPIAPNIRTLWGVGAVACLILAVLLRRILIPRIAQSFARQPWQRLARLLTTTGSALLVLLFFRFEGVPLLSSRSWLLLLGIVDLAWGAAIIWHALARVPKQRAAWEQEQVKRKYLR